MISGHETDRYWDGRGRRGSVVVHGTASVPHTQSWKPSHEKQKSHDLWGNLHHIPEPGKTEVMQFFLIQKGWLSLQDPPETQINIESIMFKILQSQTPSLKPVWVVNALQNCTKNIQTTKNLTIV